MNWRITWNGKKILADFAKAATEALQETGAAQEEAIKGQLYPGHGVATEAMKKSVHYAEAGYPWEGDAVPASPSAPERGGKKHKPAKVGSAFVIEAGSGQDYALYYHEKRDAFVRNGVEHANQKLPDRLAAQMKKRGY